MGLCRNLTHMAFIVVFFKKKFCVKLQEKILAKKVAKSSFQ